MDKLELNNTGGFPFETNDLKFMQDSYTLPLEQIAIAIAGASPAIVSGCVVTGSSVSPGFVIIAGEIMPFEGGTLATNVKVFETVENKTFEDGLSKEVYIRRYAGFSLTGTIPWSTFTQVQTLMSNLVPSGAIMMWSGAIASIPAGWKLCDGTNGTPNLKGKFIVGYDSTVADYDAPGKTGGLKEVTLTSGQLAAHDHNVYVGNNANVAGNVSPTSFDVPSQTNDTDRGIGNSSQFGLDETPLAINLTHTHTVEVDDEGEIRGQAHENRPPYFVLAYIIKG